MAVIAATALRLLTPPGSRKMSAARRAANRRASGSLPPLSMPAVLSRQRLFQLDLKPTSDFPRHHAWRTLFPRSIRLLLGLTAQQPPRHRWMLHVAEKMLGCRACSRLRYRHDRHDDAAAQLRQQFDHRDAGSHSHADNSDRNPHLHAASIDRCRVRAVDRGGAFPQDEKRPVYRPRSIQLQRGQHIPGHLEFGNLVR
jgi:hypothetical protein